MEFKCLGSYLSVNELNCRLFHEVSLYITRSLDSEQAPCQPRRFTTCIKSTSCQVQLTLGQPERLTEPSRVPKNLLVSIAPHLNIQWCQSCSGPSYYVASIRREVGQLATFSVALGCQDTKFQASSSTLVGLTSTKKLPGGPQFQVKTYGVFRVIWALISPGVRLQLKKATAHLYILETQIRASRIRHVVDDSLESKLL